MKGEGIYISKVLEHAIAVLLLHEVVQPLLLVALNLQTIGVVFLKKILEAVLNLSLLLLYYGPILLRLPVFLNKAWANVKQ